MSINPAFDDFPIVDALDNLILTKAAELAVLLGIVEEVNVYSSPFDVGCPPVSVSGEEL